MKKVAFGSGLALIPCLKNRIVNSSLKLSPSFKPLIKGACVIFLPSRGMNPWFARVFNIGQGPRTSLFC